MRIYGDELHIISSEKKFNEFIEKRGYRKFAERDAESIYANEDAKVIRVFANNGGYVVYVVSRNDTEAKQKYAKYVNVFGKTLKVCTIVAALFLEQKKDDGFYELVHVDGNVRNDVASNLVWRLRSERMYAFWQTKHAQ